MSKQSKAVARAALLAACAVATLEFLAFRFSPHDFQPSAPWVLRSFLKGAANSFHTAAFAGFWVFYYAAGRAALPRPRGIGIFHGVLSALFAAAVCLGKSYELLKSWDLLFAHWSLTVLAGIFFAAAAEAVEPALAFFDALLAPPPQPDGQSLDGKNLPPSQASKGRPLPERPSANSNSADGKGLSGSVEESASATDSETPSPSPRPTEERPSASETPTRLPAPHSGRWRARFAALGRLSAKIFGKPFWRSAAAFFAFHLFWLLAFYPGSGTADTLYQFSQWLGVIPLNTRHPPAATALMGSFLSLGQFLGNQNFGVFLYNFMQTAFQSFVFAQCVETVDALTGSKALRRFAFLWFLMNPLFPTWSATCVKDSLYSASLLWFVVSLVRIECGLHVPRSRIYVQLTASALLAASLRLNGPLVVAASLTVSALFAFLKHRGGTSTMLAIAALAVGVSVAPVLCLKESERYTALREAFSLPLQQTARVLWSEREISAEDRSALNRLFHGRNLRRIYDPELAAPVKWAWGDDNRPPAEWKNFLKIWHSLLVRYPADFIQAALNSCYGYFYPAFSAAEDQSDMADFVPHERLHGIRLFLRRSGWGAAQNALLLWVEAVKSLPLTGLVYSCAFYVWATLFLTGTALFRRKHAVLVVAAPLLLTLGSSLFGSIDGCLRYLLPLAAALPLLLACVARELSAEN